MTDVEDSIGPVDPAQEQVVPLRTEMRNGLSALRSDIADVSTQMRVLHEDVIERLKLIQEGQQPKPRKRSGR